MTSRLLILGSSGFLGSNVQLQAIRSDLFEVWAHSRNGDRCVPGAHPVGGDLLAAGVVERLVGDIEPDVVLNCAALASVDACERNPELALRLNAELAACVAESVALVGGALVHVSTDAVFGARPGPYEPASSVSPINAYGRSKAAGEEAVLDACPEALVVRTNVVGWSPSGQRSLLEFFHSALAEGRTVPGFGDVYFRPMSAGDFWTALELLLDISASGIHHLVGSNRLSKFEFGQRVARTFGYSEELVRPAKVDEGNLDAQRGGDLDLVPDPMILQRRADLLDLSAALQGLRDNQDDRWALSALNGEVERGRI